MSEFVLTKRFDTEVERTQRVLDVAEMFGLGLDDKTFTVLNDLKLEIRDGDIVYITGQSGSGKSTILKELRKEFEKLGKKIAVAGEIEMQEVPIVDQVYPEEKSLSKPLELFSLVGLSDANLFLRKPSELSDGQRYRFMLAKMIESGAEIWMADEFLALLDRMTAKVIAYNVQKIARKVGATLVVATTHRDMVEDLAPSLFIEKGYQDKVKKLVTEENLELLGN